MNTRFPSAVVGTTLCANNTDNYVIEAGALSFGGLPVSALDGQLVEVFVRYPDNTTSGYEQVWGIYTHSTTTVARTKVGQSSAGEGTKVNWGNSAPKLIVFVTSGSQLGNMARIFLALDPWEDILVGATGQSNLGTLAYYEGATPADTDRVLDWSRAVPGTGSNAWRTVAKAEQYTDYSDSVPYIGTTRSKLDTTTSPGVWKACGSIVHSFARQLATITGRKVRTVSVYRGGTSLNDPTYGWIYDTSATNAVSKVFADAVDAAITQMHTDDPRQASVTKLHVYLFGQGENDAVIAAGGSPFYASESAEYGYLLADHIKALEDSDRWNIADENTISVLFDIPEPARKLEDSQSVGVNTFDGHAQAQAILGDRCIVIPTSGIPTKDDQIHYWGEGADELGARGADVLMSPTAPNGNTGGAFRLVKTNAWPVAAYTWEADSDSAPSTNSRWRFSLAQDEFKITYVSGSYGDTSAIGLGLFQINDIIRMENQSTPAIYVDVRITGRVTDNTTYYTYPCEIVAEAGTRTAVAFLIKPQNTAWHDGKSYNASTNHSILSGKQSLANAETTYSEGIAATTGAEISRNHHYLMADQYGKQARSRQLAVRYGELRTTDATANQVILGAKHFEDGRVEYIRATVCYKIPASGNIGVFQLHAIIRRTGTTTSADWAPAATVLIDEEALATDPNIAAASLIGLVDGYDVRVTGKASTTIDWVCEVETIVIPTLA